MPRIHDTIRGRVKKRDVLVFVCVRVRERKRRSERFNLRGGDGGGGVKLVCSTHFVKSNQPVAVLPSEPRFVSLTWRTRSPFFAPPSSSPLSRSITLPGAVALASEEEEGGRRGRIETFSPPQRQTSPPPLLPLETLYTSTLSPTCFFLRLPRKIKRREKGEVGR